MSDNERPVVLAGPTSLTEIIERASPGTTIELTPGTYPPLLIESKHDLIIRAERPGTALFTAGSYDVARGIEVLDSTFITLEGLSIEEVKWGVSVASSDDVLLSNLLIRDVGQRGVWVHGRSSRFTLVDSTIARTGRREGLRVNGSPNSSLGEGVYIGNSADPTDDTNTIIVSRNHISETTAEAIDLKAGTHGIQIAFNVIHSVTARTGAIALHPGGEPSNPGWVRIRNNVVSDVQTSSGEGGNGIVVSALASVDANIVFDAARHGIVVDEVYGPDRRVTLRNNSVFWSIGDNYAIRHHDPELPEPTLWGNQGLERFDGFPTGWVENGSPTRALRQALLVLREEVDAVEAGVADVVTVDAAPVETPTPPPTQPREVVVADDPVVAPNAPGNGIPVYDTAWQMLVRATPRQADEYFGTLSDYGFTGSWAAIIHHAPATYLHSHAGGGQVGRLENGQIVLNDAYIRHVRSILDTAQRHGQKIGLIAAWQNTYLPGGNTGADAISNQVEGTLTTTNAYAYGRQIAAAFGDHPAVSHWVFGGDAGTNNTEANKAVWRVMAQALDDAGMTQPIGYHTPTVHFDQLNYAGEQWLDFVAPETGHNQGPDRTEAQLRAAVNAYDVPVWQGEPRYFGINFSSWIQPQFQNPGRNEVVADAQAARRAGVSGYVYGDAGRWAWCLFQGDGDASPCNANNISASFGQAERDVIAALRN